MATSADGVAWAYHGPWVAKSESKFEAYGNVTPFLLVGPGRDTLTLYVGAAAAMTWDQNSIAVHRLTGPELDALAGTARNDRRGVAPAEGQLAFDRAVRPERRPGPAAFSSPGPPGKAMQLDELVGY